MPTLLRKNNVTAPLQFPTERRNGVGRSSERPALDGQDAHQRRGAADSGQRGETAGVTTKVVLSRVGVRCLFDDPLPPVISEPLPNLGHIL